MAETHSVFLTFDVEDFVNDRSNLALYSILMMLKRYELKAIFFITGEKCEKLHHTRLLRLLEEHMIGYHSASHSVHPRILEYTDVKSYDEAYMRSVERETSKIDPLTGKVEGEGGIILLRALFKNKEVVAFRAPDYGWSPPHLEALKSLRIKFDFSTDLSQVPFTFKQISFYPFAFCNDIPENLFRGGVFASKLLRKISKTHVTVLNFHPWFYVNNKPWNFFYNDANPKELILGVPRSPRETQRLFSRLEILLKNIKALEKLGLVEITPELHTPKERLKVDEYLVWASHRNNMLRFERICNRRLRFIQSHVRKFFDLRERHARKTLSDS